MVSYNADISYVCACVCVSARNLAATPHKNATVQFLESKKTENSACHKYMLLHFSHSIENGFRSNQMCAQRKEIYLKSFFLPLFIVLDS